MSPNDGMINRSTLFVFPGFSLTTIRNDNCGRTLHLIINPPQDIFDCGNFIQVQKSYASLEFGCHVRNDKFFHRQQRVAASLLQIKWVTERHCTPRIWNKRFKWRRVVKNELDPNLALWSWCQQNRICSARQFSTPQNHCMTVADPTKY